MRQSDAAFVGRVLDGDVQAFAVLVRRHRARCMRYAVHMLGSVHDAEEVVQEAFIRAYRSLANCEEPDRFAGWLFRILVNRCRTAGARRSRRESLFTAEPAVERIEANAGATERDEWREEIDRALRKLPHEQREAFLLKYVEELSYPEMTELTGRSISALKMRVSRAAIRLRTLLSEVHRAAR